MQDSRFSATKYYLFKKHWATTRKVISFLAVILLALAGTRFLSMVPGITPPALNAFFILVLAGGLWITEAIPPFAVSLLIIGFCIYFLDNRSPTSVSADWEEYVNTWSSPVIWIFMGGFFLATGAQLTGFDRKFSQFVLTRFGSAPYSILLGSMLSTAVLSMFMSNTATTAMMLTLVMPLIRQLEKDEPLRKAMLIGIAAAGTMGGMGTIIGTPPNAIAVGIIQNHGLDFGFVDWMLIGAPMALLLTVGTWYLIRIKYKTRIEKLDVQAMVKEPADTEEAGNAAAQHTFVNRVVVVGTFCVTIGLWLSSAFHGLPVAVVAFIPIVVFTVSGVVRPDDVKTLPWDTLILVAGGLTLGTAIQNTGLAELLVNKLPLHFNLFVILLIMGYATSLGSNVMSNTAAASIIIPIGVALMPTAVVTIALGIALSASTALFLPISTPPNAIAFSTGYIKQADFRYLGIIIGGIVPFFIQLVLILSL